MYPGPGAAQNPEEPETKKLLTKRFPNRRCTTLVTAVRLLAYHRFHSHLRNDSNDEREETVNEYE